MEEQFKSPQSQRRQFKSSLTFAMTDPQRREYEALVESYEQALAPIMAKDIMRFKNCSGKGMEYAIGLALLYFMVSQDSSILLSNDKKVILN